MKNGTKKCRGEEALVLTTEYTEQVQRYSGLEGLESTPSKPVSVCSVWERKRPFSVFCGKKKVPRKNIHISWKVNVLWRVRFATETFVPFFMKSGTKKCRGEEALFLTTEYTEAVEPYLKNTEMDSVYSVWRLKAAFPCILW